MSRILCAALIAALPLVGGCVAQHSVHVEPVRLEPIRVTMDVNVRVQNESAGGHAPAVEDAGAATRDGRDASRPASAP